MPPAFIPSDRKGFRILKDIRKGPLSYFTRLMNEEGDYAWFKILNRPTLLLNDATGIQHVFQESVDTYNKSAFYDNLKPLMGDGLLLTEGDLWRRQRRETAPAFSNGNFPQITDEILSAAESMFRRWDEMIAQDKPLDINIEFMWFALDALLRALYHEDRDNIAKGTRESLGHMLAEAEGRIWSMISLPQAITYRLSPYRQARKFLRGLVDNLVDARRQNQAYPEDLLSRLVQSYGTGKRDQKMLQDQVLSFLLAGHETTAIALSWCWYEVSQRPDIQEKLRAEADAVLGSEPLTYENVKELDYARQVFFEALRLYPPAWTMSRKAMRDDVIPLDNGKTISVSKDDTIMMCANAVHRREIYWPHPEAFMPERFSAEAMRSRPKMAWFPFGAGPRLCIGLKFAEIEGMAVLAMIARRYNLSLVPGHEVRAEPNITLRPSNSIYLRAEKRNIRSDVSHDERRDIPASTGKCPFSAVA
jgi:cytochrome P450